MNSPAIDSAEHISVLSAALDHEEASPSEPQLTKSIRAEAFWSFDQTLEVVYATTSASVNDRNLRAAWAARLDRRPIPLVVVVKSPRGLTAVGPAGTLPPIAEVSIKAIASALKDCLGKDALDVRLALTAALARADSQAGAAGLTNRNLFSAHYLQTRVPLLPNWDRLQELGRDSAAKQSVDARFEALGFRSEQQQQNVFLLSANSSPAAAVCVFPPASNLDTATPGGELPVAGLLNQMRHARVEWGILAAGDVWRLYRSDVQSPTDSYAEIEIDKLAAPGYFALLFSAEALADGGLAEDVLKGSAEFALGLGRRLRARVYEQVVPLLVRGFANGAQRRGAALTTRDELTVVYDATLTVLYRLLFLFYAEARRYLPVETNEAYTIHSLRKIVELAEATADGTGFSDDSTDYWTDLKQLFDAVSEGHSEWGVPAYNGRLFSRTDDRPHAVFLQETAISNAELGPALLALALDSTEEGDGRVDYADLDIRRLGDIYEGLLQFEVERADRPLILDEKADVFRPIAEGETPDVSQDEVFVRARGGGRKASGSFYTPQFIVRHVVVESLVPALNDHLDRVANTAREDPEAAAHELFQFSICDPAMGSGHFLVDALSVATQRIALWLTENPLPPVSAMLGALRESASSQARGLGAHNLADVQDVDLLKRLVLKRCIYGVDRNAMAVDLARLALWLEAFVPGLPLSYLDHNLQHGNSLVGVVGDEVIRAVSGEDGGNISLAAAEILETMSSSMTAAFALTEQVEYGKADVERSRVAERDLRDQLAGLRTLYDMWTVEPFINERTREVIRGLESPKAASSMEFARSQFGDITASKSDELAAAQAFFHWPLAFPEIFARARPGFDVVIANPPWEKIKPEKHNYYALFAPGLKGVRDAGERDRIVAELDARGAGAAEAFSRAQDEYEATKRYFASAGGNYALGGSGDIDLFKSFAERFIRLVRPDGAIGAVLPRQLLSGVGTSKLRLEYIANNDVQAIDVLQNRNHWAFENVHSQYTIVLVSLRARRADPRDATVPVAGPIDTKEEFAQSTGLRVRWPLSTLREWNASLTVPLLSDAKSGRLYSKLLRHPRFDHSDPKAWSVAPYREMDGTQDRKKFPEMIRAETFESSWPAWSGRNFDQYRIHLGDPVLWVEHASYINWLLEKRHRSKIAAGSLSEEELLDPSSLEINRPRLAFRRQTNRTNSRTVIAALLPPHVACVEDAPSLVFRSASALEKSYVLGLMNSVVFDWLCRRMVDSKISFEILRATPVPRPPSSSELFMTISTNAARLSCVDERFSEFAFEVGISTESIDGEAREQLLAEIDACVASAYGLSREELVFIFEDFNEKGLPHDRREKILELFEGFGK